MSKCHIVGKHMSRLILKLFYSKRICSTNNGSTILVILTVHAKGKHRVLKRAVS